MKLLWLCNMVPGAIQEKLSGNPSGGLWVDNMLSDLRKREDVRMHILCAGAGEYSGQLDEKCSFSLFSKGRPDLYRPELESCFAGVLKDFAPDVIHIWGTEFAHTLALVNACEGLGLLDRTVVSIQGLCSVYADHYAEGVPYAVRRGFTFRDFVKQDNICQQQQTFVRRGDHEVEALKKVRHVIGRTDWDFACAVRVNPDVTYHFCNETLRKPFYEDRWKYESCRKHRIFASSCAYPIKGFHYLLEAFAQVLKTYPDATLAVPGKDPDARDFRSRLRQSGYQRYLAKQIRELGLQGKVEFLGSLTAEQMKENYLRAHVFVLPSTIENSPNSLGEAMLLGVPCVASDVGGVTTMMNHGTEGLVYQSTAPYMLAHYIQKVFSLEDQVFRLTDRAHAHAAVTHDPKLNLEDLLEIYRLLAGEKGANP